MASKSPRRVEILNNLGLTFTVCPSSFEENLDKSSLTPAQYVIETSKGKGQQIYEEKCQEGEFSGLIISADTVVVLDDEILEKPRDNEHAYEMLSSLSGRQSLVYTGVTLLGTYLTKNHNDEKKRVKYMDCFSEKTIVNFAALSEEVIRAYIATGEPLGKAGSYGIQGMLSHLIFHVFCL